MYVESGRYDLYCIVSFSHGMFCLLVESGRCDFRKAEAGGGSWTALRCITSREVACTHTCSVHTSLSLSLSLNT